MGKHTAEDHRDGMPVFIHSEIDDFGLNAFEFRAYAHLARRVNDKDGTYYESLEEGAKVCRMNVKTYRAALSALVDRGLVSRKDRAGQTSVYRLEPRQNWKPLPNQEGVPNQVALPEQVEPPTTSGRTPLPDQVDKGTPLKVLPKGSKKKREKKAHAFNPETVDLPPNFDREHFIEFCAARLRNDKPMTERALSIFLKKHGRHDKSTLDAMFEDAAIGEWQDLYYPPKGRDEPQLARKGDSGSRAAQQATNLLAHLERRAS